MTTKGDTKGDTKASVSGVSGTVEKRKRDKEPAAATTEHNEESRTTVNESPVQQGSSEPVCFPLCMCRFL
jgi:hypothetical protein